MKRRGFLQSLAVTPAAMLPLTAEPSVAAAAPAQEDVPKYELTSPDAVAEPVARFFNADQFAALRKLSAILMPAFNGMPGALECEAPEFLDFLVGKSPAERKRIYTTGLDLLNAQARKRFNRRFADLEDAQAAELLAPLRQAWTYNPPADPLARFLREAKADVRNATTNSRAYVMAGSSGGRRGGGMGQYWYPID